MLICKFASDSSSPARIDSYVEYLRSMERQKETDAKTREVIAQLLDEAQQWQRRNNRPD